MGVFSTIENIILETQELAWRLRHMLMAMLAMGWKGLGIAANTFRRF